MCLFFVSSWNNLWDQERFGVMFTVFCHTSAPCLYVYDGFSSAIFESDVFSHHFLTHWLQCSLQIKESIHSLIWYTDGCLPSMWFYLYLMCSFLTMNMKMQCILSATTWSLQKTTAPECSIRWLIEYTAVRGMLQAPRSGVRAHCPLIADCSFNFYLHQLCLVGWDGMYACLLPLFHLLAWQSAPMFLSAGTSTSRSPVQYSNTRMTSQIALIGYCANSTCVLLGEIDAVFYYKLLF